MDVVSAYLLGELEEEAFLSIPEGVEANEDTEILRLLKGIPGLKQSGRVWNKKITAVFEEFGLYAIPADHSVFVNAEYTLIVALYVDDLLILAINELTMQPLKRELTERFEIKDGGPVEYILGVRIQRDTDGTIRIDQKHYIEDTLRDEGIDPTDVPTPIPSTPAKGYESLTPTAENDKPIDPRKVQRVTGKLNWLVRATRPDIAFTT